MHSSHSVEKKKKRIPTLTRKACVPEEKPTNEAEKSQQDTGASLRRKYLLVRKGMPCCGHSLALCMVYNVVTVLHTEVCKV